MMNRGQINLRPLGAIPVLSLERKLAWPAHMNTKRTATEVLCFLLRTQGRKPSVGKADLYIRRNQ